MPLGIDSVNPMAIAAMGERYGDRLVNSLTQAGQTIETGLKAVTTIRELKSLGQSLSQLSPESPDYQQQLIGLGASHPFAMQTPQAQQMLQAGNQHHLQWKNQQHAIAMNERQEARADARVAMSEKNQLRRDATQMAIAKMRYAEDGNPLAPVARVPDTMPAPPPTLSTPPPSLMDMWGGGRPSSIKPSDEEMAAQDAAQAAAPQVPRTLSRADIITNTIADVEEGSGIVTTAKQRQSIAANVVGAENRGLLQEDRQAHSVTAAAEAATSRATAADILADRKAEAAKLAASERRFLAREKQESNYTPEQKLRLSHIEKQINDLDISETKNRTDSRTLPSKDARTTAAAAAEADRAKIEKLEKDFNDILESKASKGKPGDAAGGRNREWTDFINK